MAIIFDKVKEILGIQEYPPYEDDITPQPLASPTGQTSTPSRTEDYSESSRSYPQSEMNTVPTYSQSPVSPSFGSNPMNSAPNNVVGMPGNRWWGAVAEVVVMEPRHFDEMPQVIQSLKDRKSVVLNLTMMDADQAQRAVDFVAGATFTIDGHQERIGESIFLFTPSCVQVSTQAGSVREVPPPSAHAIPAPSPAWNTAAAM